MLYIKEPATHMHICGNNEGLSLKYSLTCIYLKLANVLRVRAPNCPSQWNENGGVLSSEQALSISSISSYSFHSS